jgi:hypothetical protein
MRKPHGRLGPILLVAACSAVLAGCKDEFVDKAFGVLDLASVYDGGTSSDPSAGIPELIDPSLGYIDGSQAEYYDFGTIPVRRNPFTGVPQAAAVQPMYFFFDTARRPLFSSPIRETRDGTDWIKGGTGVLNPNPKDFCPGVSKEDRPKNPCHTRYDFEQKKPYALRFREPYVDRLRKVADYQRPLIDTSPADRSTAGHPYTGLWEIVEVVVADGYVPDSVKHKATMDKAISAGKMNLRKTGKVINCPIVDERSVVARGVADRVTPHPRIELWYRRQMTYCYLANGWETLGNDRGEPFLLNSDAERVQTFDLLSVNIGEGAVKETQLVVPIARAFTPIIQTTDQSGNPPMITRVVDNVLTEGQPRRTNADPPGYTPIRWMWDFGVSTDYPAGGLNAVSKLDAGNTRSTTAVKNLPLRGLRAKCGYQPQPSKGDRCGKLEPDPANPNVTVLNFKGDEVCTKDGLECNPDSCFCDAPFVGYGAACGPGIAQCNTEEDKFSKHGYTCLFQEGGYCYMRCDTSDTNEFMAKNAGKMPVEILDSRCKGVPGFTCLGYGPGNEGICLKFCDGNVSDENQCQAQSTMDGMEKDINKGQTCQDFGLEVCAWPDGFEPLQ